MDDVSFVDDIMHYEGWLKLPLSRNTRLIFFFLQRMRLNVSSSLVFGFIIDGVYSELLPVCNYRLKGVSFVFLSFLIIIGMICTLFVMFWSDYFIFLVYISLWICVFVRCSIYVLFFLLVVDVIIGIWLPNFR